MKLEFAAETHQGMVRKRNEDAWGVRPSGICGLADELSYLFAVADGMGGHPGGDLASDLVVRAALEPGVPDEGIAPAALSVAFDRAVSTVEAAARKNPDMADMGTTLTLLGLEEGLGWIGHIGDTRLYWKRNERWMLLTRDHTMAQDLVDAGTLDQQAAEKHHSSHVLTRCIGCHRRVSPDLLRTPIRVRAGDRFLLCSDGLVKVVPEGDLDTLIGDSSPDEGVRRLVQACLDGGAPDNVTVMLGRIVDPGPESAHTDAVDIDDGSSVLIWKRSS